MILTLTDEQQQLQQSTADFFTRRSTAEVVRAAEPLGHDHGLWRAMLDLGMVGIAAPVSVGGGGGGLLDLAVVALEAGRRLAPIPLVDAAPAVNLLCRLGEEGLARAVVDEGTIPTLATGEPKADRLEFVSSGAIAGLVVARRGDDVILVRPTGERSALANFASAPLAHIDIVESSTEVIGSGEEALHWFDVALWERRVLMSASLVGLALQAIDLTLDYIGQRMVYGRPVAEFQAVQHRLVDVFVAVTGARFLAFEAAWALDTASPRAEELAHMAMAFSAESAFRTCRECMQFHGGYGYTLEYDIQLYFRRAKGWPQLVTASDWQRIADLTCAGTVLSREGVN